MATFKITFLSVSLCRRVSFARSIGLKSDYLPVLLICNFVLSKRVSTETDVGLLVVTLICALVVPLP